MFAGKLNENIRNNDLVLHCVNVKIFQKLIGGMELSGHGTIKINEVGTLYLEFICTEKHNAPKSLFGERFPQDVLDKSQSLHLEALTVDGELFEASNFFMEVSYRLHNLPAVQYIFLPSISCKKTAKEGYYDKESDYLYFEFVEKLDIPFNKSNTSESSLGSASVSWNQADIKMEGYLVTIIHHKDHTSVVAKGIFDIDVVRESLKFYIGFSSGSMPQLGYMDERKGTECIKRLSSINNTRKQQTAASPLVTVPHEYHYNLFKCITKLYAEKHSRFESIVAQWERVWFASQSKDEILSLTLSVAIEGVLNDIYIPYIKSSQDTVEDKVEHSFIKNELRNTALTDQQKSRILGSVANWKNITSANAFDHLIEKGLFENKDKSDWTKLRNRCAHPKLIAKNIEDEKAEIELITSCLNILFGLILNTLEYTGDVAYLIPRQWPKLYLFEHCNILD